MDEEMPVHFYIFSMFLFQNIFFSFKHMNGSEASMQIKNLIKSKLYVSSKIIAYSCNIGN